MFHSKTFGSHASTFYAMNVINGVNKLLTTPAMTAMNKAVAIDKQDEATVARQFLTANHVT